MIPEELVDDVGVVHVEAERRNGREIKSAREGWENERGRVRGGTGSGNALMACFRADEDGSFPVPSFLHCLRARRITREIVSDRFEEGETRANKDDASKFKTHLHSFSPSISVHPVLSSVRKDHSNFGSQRRNSIEQWGSSESSRSEEGGDRVLA